MPYSKKTLLIATAATLLGTAALADNVTQTLQVPSGYARTNDAYVPTNDAPPAYEYGTMQPAATVQPDYDTLQTQQVGNISYVTGGIGDEERAALQNIKGRYNLYVMSAWISGEFEGDTAFSIRDKSGTELVNIPDAGPITYANLPAGTYTIVGSSMGETKQQKITVGSGKTANVHFSWK